MFGGEWSSVTVGAYPATLCEITYLIAGTDVAITPTSFKGDGLSIKHGTFTDCGPISIGPNPLAALELDDLVHTVARSKVVRNDSCPCGSNIKYKKCCGRQ